MNDDPRRPVHSAQGDVHSRLEETLQRHIERPWRGGTHGPSEAAFAAVAGLLRADDGRPLIFDSGCGTGASTRLIAAAYPDRLVIGIDRSAARLARLRAPTSLPHRDKDIIWVRAELATFWRLALESGWHLERHFLLYPNPWPKPSQLRRRWHGHPVFPVLLALGGRLEMRTNWLVYAREFARAGHLATGIPATPEAVGSSSISSPFERKYRARGDALYRVRMDLPASR